MIAPEAGPDCATHDFNSRRLWSLWDMINCNLSGLVLLFRNMREEHAIVSGKLQSIAHFKSNPEIEGTTPIEVRFMTPNEIGRLDAMLERALPMCIEHGLKRTYDRLERFQTALTGATPTPVAIQNQMNVLQEAIEDDLKRKSFYRYPGDRAQLVLRIGVDWAPTLKGFKKSAPREIEAGVDCYAIGHNTACVFHMMRIAELGLRALARERGIQFSDKPIEWADWQNLIEKVRSEGEARAKEYPKGPERDAVHGFYNGAVAHFAAFKDKYRNAVMHFRKSYNETDASKAMNQVRDFMNELSAKIGENTKRPITKWP